MNILLNYFIQNGHEVERIKEGNISTLNKEPDLVLSNQAWWGFEYDIGIEAKSLNIPHVTIEHGAPFFYQGGKQYYRKNIGAADLKLLWGQFNLNMMKKYKCPENLLKVTGFPRFDDLIKFKPISNSTPRVLFLSTWKIPGQIKEIWKKTVSQAKNMGYNLAFKYHPQEYQRGFMIKQNDIPSWVEIIKNENLYEEVSKSDLVISTPTSVLIAALYFKKPIFCYYPVFMKNYWKGLFEFYRKFNFIPKSNRLYKFDLKKLVESNPNSDKYIKMLDYVANGIDGKSCQNIYNECMTIL